MNRARGHVCRPTRPPQHQETSVGPSPPCVRMPTATLKALFSRVQFRTEKCSRKPGGRGSDVCDRQRSAGPNLPVGRFFPHVSAQLQKSRFLALSYPDGVLRKVQRYFPSPIFLFLKVKGTKVPSVFSYSKGAPVVRFGSHKSLLGLFFSGQISHTELLMSRHI